MISLISLIVTMSLYYFSLVAEVCEFAKSWQVNEIKQCMKTAGIKGCILSFNIPVLFSPFFFKKKKKYLNQTV